MATKTYPHFIPENIAPKDAVALCVYKNGAKLATFELGNLTFPEVGERLYKFGALSDVHISPEVETSEEDFRRALTYLQDKEYVDFVTIAGDLTQYATEEEWLLYKQCVEEESENTPVYPIGGNHDCYGTGLTDSIFKQYTGLGTFYTFEQGNDVFIMLSQLAWASQSGGIQPFTTSQLQSLYEALENNRNKRCFVFQHIFPWGKSGDPFELYGSNSFWGTQGTVIYSLMEHYPNTIWFHGHSHQMFEVQEQHDKATYDFDRNCHSIHIPSCSVPKNVIEGTTTEQLNSGSQGYVVDVYENGIHLRGRDFVKEEFLPIASYWIDTPLSEVEGGTYTDSTGTIVT